jgi:Flp pilus assembly protein TadD, contains TPR repeats
MNTGELDNTIKEFKIYISALNNLGLIRLQKGQYGQAITLFRKSRQIKPDYLEGLYDLWLAYYFKGDLDGAIDTWEKVASVAPAYKNVHNDLSVSYENKGSFHASIAEHERALEELGNSDRSFSVVFPACAKEKDMLVVNRRKLLPAVTIGLTKEEAEKLAKVLGESNVEISFCLNLLTDIDFVVLEEKIASIR